MKDEDILKIIIKYRPKKLKPEHVEGMMFVLGYLDKNGSCNVKEIGDSLNVSSARMAVILNKLEDKGFVRRYKSEKDKRVTLVELLDNGKNMISKVEEGLLKRFRIIEANLGEAEFHNFMMTLDKIAEIDFGDDLKC